MLVRTVLLRIVWSERLLLYQSGVCLDKKDRNSIDIGVCFGGELLLITHHFQRITYDCPRYFDNFTIPIKI